METRGCSELTRGFGDALKEPRIESGHRAAQRDEQERNSKDQFVCSSCLSAAKTILQRGPQQGHRTKQRISLKSLCEREWVHSVAAELSSEGQGATSAWVLAERTGVGTQRSQRAEGTCAWGPYGTQEPWRGWQWTQTERSLRGFSLHLDISNLFSSCSVVSQ